MNRFFVLCAILLFPALVFAQSGDRTYSNARFGFSIRYPAGLLAPEPEADNGDGRVFTGEGAEMRVYGSNLLLNETLLKEFNAVVAEYGAGVAYRTYRRNWFVVSALKDGRIFYRKTIARANGTFVTFQIEYDEAKRAVYDAAVAKMVKSFK